MGIAEEERPAYDDAPPLRIVDNAPRFAMLWEAVLFDHELTSNAKVIYGVLQRMAHEERGTLAPSKNDIGNRSGVKDRGTVLACLKALEERGYIKLEPRGQWETDAIILVDPSEFPAGKTSTLREKPAGKTCGKNQHPAGNSRTPLREKPAPPAGISRTLNESNREIERTTASAAVLTPFLAFSVACDEAHLDPGGFTEKDRGKHMAVAKRLIADGLTEDDLRGVIRWLVAKGWSDPITLWTVERRISEWRAAGRPGPAQPRPRSTYTSQADWNAAGQRNPDGSLKLTS